MQPASASRAVVVVDDNPDDIFFFRRCYAKAKIAAPLAEATDGEEAVALLKRLSASEGKNGDALPLMVFLDLKLPRISGFAVLEWIRQQRVLDAVPVAVLSSSAEPRDVARAYALGAQGYLVKHPKPAEMAAAIAAAEAVAKPEDLQRIKLPGIERPST